MKDVHCTFKDTILVAGKSIEIDVTISTCFDDDYSAVDEYFESDEQKQEYFDKLSRNVLMPIIIEVSATFNGIEGNDALGGCVIETARDIDNIVSDYQMIALAKDELRANIQSVLNVFAN